MSEKCKPIYKNVNTVTSFAEKRAATVQVMNRICENEEYLYQETEELNYLCPPAVRKRFNPVLVDPDKSYGYTVAQDNVISFTNANIKEVKIDFSDMRHIDEINSTCAFESRKDNNGGFHHRATIPFYGESSVNNNCKNWNLERGVSSSWYVGYDKNKPYQIKPDWILKPFSDEIPSVCRAQTIKIPTGISAYSDAFLESVTLKIESQGDNSSQWASPLYVQIWNVEEIENSIFAPKGDPNKPLATAIFNPTETIPDVYTFLLDRPIKVNAGERYAIVVLSPLSHSSHSPMIGGWGLNSGDVEKDANGDAFVSEDNGRTWVRYGRNDEGLTWDEYKLGKTTPQDFAFQAHIRIYVGGYNEETNHYLYLKPIHTAQMKAFELTATSYGDESDETDVDLLFQYSLDGRIWYDITQMVTFNQEEGGTYPNTNEYETYPNTLFIRAVMTTHDYNYTPYIDSMKIVIQTDLPKKMYVRTPFYNPKTSPMLGANVWGRVYAPFDVYPSNADDVECKVELIQETISKEHFHIITVDELPQYIELTIDGSLILDESEMGDTSDSRAEYLIEHPSVINKLKEKQVYVKPYTLNDTEYLMSFEAFDDEGESILGGLKLTNSPAYPLESVVIQPIGLEKPQTYAEWFDFDMDYEDDTLKFTNTVLSDMPVGALAVSYNKVFIQNLTNDEIGDRVDDLGVTSQGLVLDYFKEEILITEELLETRRIPLRVVPLDPLREVKIIRSGEEINIEEDIHFTVDYAAHELIFPITNPNTGESQLQLTDTLSIVYTPAIEDTGIAVGYTVKREDLNHQIKIKPNYIEYKT